jgi:hypothetical protein
MNFAKILRGYFSLFCLGCSFFIFSCAETLETEQMVYFNDFSKLDLSGFESGRLYIFNGDTVSGYYHNEEIALNLENLPSHNLVRVTIDILIHDTWDGNQFNGISGPDFWFFGIDNQEIFRTTFSNSPCVSTYCLYQSYPDVFPRQFVPKTGALSTALPGLCFLASIDNNTTRYSISKLVEHSNSKLRIYMNSDLASTNAPDPICDESWSLAALKIETLVSK